LAVYPNWRWGKQLLVETGVERIKYHVIVMDEDATNALVQFGGWPIM